MNKYEQPWDMQERISHFQSQSMNKYELPWDMQERIPFPLSTLDSNPKSEMSCFSLAPRRGNARGVKRNKGKMVLKHQVRGCRGGRHGM